MAQPERSASTQPSAVASCSATDCKHNENRNCHAGEIRVALSADGHAACETYEPEKPRARP